VNGVLAPGSDLKSAAVAAASAPMNHDREEALALAGRAADTLLLLVGGGKTDVSSSTEGLASTLGNRPDAVVLPALGVLEFMGGPAHVERIAAVLTSKDRTEPVRLRAAQALADLRARGEVDAA
jgi:hypothetical protein